MTAAPPPLAPDLADGLPRLKLAAIRHLAPDLLSTAKTQRWAPEEHTTAVSLLDNLLHHASIVVTSGYSYRMRSPGQRRNHPEQEPISPRGGNFYLAATGDVHVHLAVDTGTHLSPFPNLTITSPNAPPQSLEMDIPLAS